jgi:glycine oxidase
MKPDDVVIIGGGVIGLSIAYVLARDGVAATVLDRRELGREASWAGAGLIPPYTRRVETDPLTLLRSWSALLYPEWSAALKDETGVDNGFRRCGGVDVAMTPQDEDLLRVTARLWESEGIAFERLQPADFGRVEPALSPAARVAYFLPDRAQIRNPRHVRALALAASRRGVVLCPGRAALGFEVQAGRVTAVRTDAGPCPCGCLIVAAGAWSAGLLEGLGVRAPTPPLKGQIVLLRSEKNLLTRIVEHGKNYLVPRGDGRILVGATEEEAGFNTSTTAFGVRALLDEALRLCPVVAEAEVERSWAGLRPGSLDGRPYLGAAPGFSNVLVATGHKRAGLQLSPATAEVMADLVLERPPRAPLDSFRIDRDPSHQRDAESFRS